MDRRCASSSLLANWATARPPSEVSWPDQWMAILPLVNLEVLVTKLLAGRSDRDSSWWFAGQKMSLRLLLIPIFEGIWDLDPFALRWLIHLDLFCLIYRGTEILLASQGSLAPQLYYRFPNLAPYFHSISTNLPPSISQYAEFNLSTIFASFYWLYYLILDPVAAVSENA